MSVNIKPMITRDMAIEMIISSRIEGMDDDQRKSFIFNAMRFGYNYGLVDKSIAHLQAELRMLGLYGVDEEDEIIDYLIVDDEVFSHSSPEVHNNIYHRIKEEKIRIKN